MRKDDDGTDGADAFFRLTAYARAWGVKSKKASAASAASKLQPPNGEAKCGGFPVAPG
jgi:hypothetical protein